MKKVLIGITVLSVVGFGVFVFLQRKKTTEDLLDTSKNDDGFFGDRTLATAQSATQPRKTGGLLGSINTQKAKAKEVIATMNAGVPPEVLAEKVLVDKAIAEKAEAFRSSIVRLENQIKNYRQMAGVNTNNVITQYQLRITSAIGELKKLGYTYNSTTKTVAKIV